MKPMFDAQGNQVGFQDAQGRITDGKGHILGYQNSNGAIVIGNRIVGSTNPHDNIPFMFNGQRNKKEK